MPPEWYIPYENNARGVPAMASFGSGYRYHVTGLIHDVRGFPTSRPDEIEPFMHRLIQKIEKNLKDIQIVDPFMVEDAEITIVAYGCVARSAKRAVIDARKRGIKAGLLRLVTLWPFPRVYVEKVAEQSKVIIVPEMNMGQISREVKRVNEGRSRVITLNKVDSNIITPQEVFKKIREVL